ncbi:hypothetical protein TRICI_003141 [Trichomonascus ciferrii]|uniref:Uncharacterized protein n=1 Tax=Trichomonascus ciferrii TaxID=44093 RepID=A0A642V3Y9_9ASCO|nr:hypothetical protein TRICI_003141 [Trichomonascus ciferrii]
MVRGEDYKTQLIENDEERVDGDDDGDGSSEPVLEGVINAIVTVLGVGDCAHPKCGGEGGGPVAVHEEHVACIKEEDPDEDVGKDAADDALVVRVPMKGQGAVPEKGVEEPCARHAHDGHVDEPPAGDWPDGVGGLSVVVVHDVCSVDDHNHPRDDIMEAALELAKEKGPQRLQQLIRGENVAHVLGGVPDGAVTGPELEQIQQLEHSLQKPVVLQLALGSGEVRQPVVALLADHVVECGPHAQHVCDRRK